MLKCLALGFGLGMAVQAWRNFPADGPVAPEIAMFAAGLAIIAAYFGGRARRRPTVNLASAVASAEASAAATGNHVQVAVVMPGSGAGAAAGRHVAPAYPTTEQSWFGGARPAITEDVLDGMDFSDLDFDHAHDVDGQTSHN